MLRVYYAVISDTDNKSYLVLLVGTKVPFCKSNQADDQVVPRSGDSLRYDDPRYNDPCNDNPRFVFTLQSSLI